jgi:hypothetical protein
MNELARLNANICKVIDKFNITFKAYLDPPKAKPN